MPRTIEDWGLTLFAVLAVGLTAYQIRYVYREWRFGEEA